MLKLKVRVPVMSRMNETAGSADKISGWSWGQEKGAAFPTELCHNLHIQKRSRLNVIHSLYLSSIRPACLVMAKNENTEQKLHYTEAPTTSPPHHHPPHLASKLYCSQPPKARRLSHRTFSSASAISSMIRVLSPSFSS